MDMEILLILIAYLTGMIVSDFLITDSDDNDSGSIRIFRCILWPVFFPCDLFRFLRDLIDRLKHRIRMSVWRKRK